MKSMCRKRCWSYRCCTPSFFFHSSSALLYGDIVNVFVGKDNIDIFILQAHACDEYGALYFLFMVECRCQLQMTLVCVKPILYSPMTWLSAKTCLAFQFHLLLLATCAFMIDSAQTKSTLKLSGITTFISAFDVLILVLDILKPFFRSSDFRSFVPRASESCVPQSSESSVPQSSESCV